MSFMASDGRNFTNRPPMKAHERLLGRMSKLDESKGEVDPLRPDHDEDDGADVAREHGPATEVTISHEGGKHHVHSRHEDGHEHQSEHGSAEEAHDHGKKLAGVGAEDEQEPEFGEQDEPEYE